MKYSLLMNLYDLNFLRKLWDNDLMVARPYLFTCCSLTQFVFDTTLVIGSESN